MVVLVVNLVATVLVEVDVRILICGSRFFQDFLLFEEKVDEVLKKFNRSAIEIISGGARGTDRLVEMYAKMHKLPNRIMKAKWLVHGKSAGPLRNSKMVEIADVCIAFLANGKDNKGTNDTLIKSRIKGIPCEVFFVDVEDFS